MELGWGVEVVVVLRLEVDHNELELRSTHTPQKTRGASSRVGSQVGRGTQTDKERENVSF